MKLIDLYVEEVGRRLPPKNRIDIENELRSTLLDMLDAKAESSHQQVNDTMVKNLLREYGSPEKVAASYRPAGYLIGPRMYPTFVMVLKIVMSVTITLSAIGLGVKLGQEANTTLQAGKILLEVIGGLFQTIFQSFAGVAFIFAVLERFLPVEEPSPDTWDPSELETKIPADHVSVPESIVAIVFSAIFLLVLNLYPDVIGVYILRDNEWVRYPLLAPAFFRYLLFFDLVWLAQIGFHVLLLREGTWTKTHRILEIALEALSLIILVVVIFGPAIVSIPPEIVSLVDPGTAAGRIAQIQQQFYTGFRAILGLIAGLSLLKIGRKVYENMK
jgi:hypothetical protein